MQLRCCIGGIWCWVPSSCVALSVSTMQSQTWTLTSLRTLREEVLIEETAAHGGKYGELTTASAKKTGKRVIMHGQKKTESTPVMRP